MISFQGFDELTLYTHDETWYKKSPIRGGTRYGANQYNTIYSIPQFQSKYKDF